MTKQNDHKNDSDESASNSTQNSNGPSSDEFLKIVSLNDHNLKELGESLSNHNSREVIQLLLDSEMTAKQISDKTGISLSHTIYHLDKLQKAEIVIVTKTEKNEKGHDMKYYSSKFSLVIVPHQIYEKTYKSKSPKNGTSVESAK